MMRFAVVFCVFGLLLALTGCPGSPLKGDQEMQGLVAAMKEASEAKEPAKAAAAAERVMEARRKVDALNLTAEEKQKLNEKYKGELAKYK